jgi:CheY-like chemotaxis protein
MPGAYPPGLAYARLARREKFFLICVRNKPSISNMKILLVDDDTNNRDLQSRIIKKLGFEVDSVVSGEEGIQYALEREYDLIFFDYLLPGISGADAVKYIRENHKGKRIPIIALTGVTDDFNYLEYGFDDLMAKPISIDDFRQTLKKWLPGAS